MPSTLNKHIQSLPTLCNTIVTENIQGTLKKQPSGSLNACLKVVRMCAPFWRIPLAYEAVGQSRALAHGSTLLIVLEANGTFAFGVRFHVFFAFLSEQRFARLTCHSSRLIVPGVTAIRADRMRSEQAWKFLQVQAAEGGSQDNDEVDDAMCALSACC